MKYLTQDNLRNCIDYNKKSGVFTWKRNKGGAIKGSVAGFSDKNGYIVINIFNKRYFAHRLAWYYVHGYFPEHQIDHRDRDKSNNKFTNLRHVTQSCNIINRAVRPNNKSGITGVYYDKNRDMWVATIKKDNKGRYLGGFKEKVDAAKARWNAEKELKFISCNKNSSAYKYIKEHRDTTKARIL